MRRSRRCGGLCFGCSVGYEHIKVSTGAVAEVTLARPAARNAMSEVTLGELERAISCYRHAMRLRPDTFGRIVQALPSTQRGMLWLDTRKLRGSLVG